MLLASISASHERQWPCSTDCPAEVAGRDMEVGRSGGTWMAMNKASGKIGVLLNILQPNHEVVASKRGRGFIVNNFVTGSASCKEYLSHLSREGSEYNGFQAISLQIRGGSIDAAYYSNFANKEPEDIGYGLHGYGNALDPHQPWPKVEYGRKRFRAVLSQHPTTRSRDRLIDDLLDAMMDKTLLPVDQQMKTQGEGRSLESLRRTSALLVQMPEVNYGSR